MKTTYWKLDKCYSAIRSISKQVRDVKAMLQLSDLFLKMDVVLAPLYDSLKTLNKQYAVAWKVSNEKIDEYNEKIEEVMSTETEIEINKIVVNLVLNEDEVLDIDSIANIKRCFWDLIVIK